jgi:hypothetical protein
MCINTTMNSLDLENTGMTDVSAKEFAEVIKTHPALLRFYMGENSITDVAGVPIANALETNTILAVLSMPNNELTDDTALAILKALSTNTTVNTLDIGWNDFGCQVYVQLAHMIEQHQRQLSLNVEEMAMRHISWLKEEEKRLFQFRADIREKVEEIELATGHRKTKEEILTAYKQEKLEELQRAEAASSFGMRC